MDKFDILKKYNIKSRCESGYKKLCDLGETDLISRFLKYAEDIDREYAKVFHKLRKLMDDKKCLKLSQIPNPNNLSEQSCFFWNLSNENLCNSCEFFNSKLRELIESKDELAKASKEFRSSAEKMKYQR